jgi:LAO/AO transport system kinase
MVQDRLQARLRHDPALKARTPKLEAAVAAGEMAPTAAADEIARALGL